MIKIQITSPEIREMKGIGKTSGKPYHMRFQSGYAFTVDASGAIAEFPDKFEITLEDGQFPYQRGTYQLQPSAVYVNRDGRLEVRPRLAPVPNSSRAAA
jgi:hypothetical protein